MSGDALSPGGPRLQAEAQQAEHARYNQPDRIAYSKQQQQPQGVGDETSDYNQTYDDSYAHQAGEAGQYAPEYADGDGAQYDRATYPYDPEYDHQPYNPEYADTASHQQHPYDESDVNPFDGEGVADGIDIDVVDLPEVPLREPISDAVFKKSKYYLYLTYALSAWGDRMWEFAAIVFIVDLYPDSLLYPSIFGLIEKLAAIVFGPSIGRHIDTKDRLQTIRTCIIGQNGSICLASIVFALAFTKLDSNGFVGLCYFFILMMGAFAQVAAVGAKISIHKDWIIVLADGQPHRLTSLNTNMRRIDLICNILAPLLVGLISISSSTAAVTFVGVWSFISLFLEFILVTWVYSKIQALHDKEKYAAVKYEKELEQHRMMTPQTTTTAIETLSDYTRPIDRITMKSLAVVQRIKIEIRRYIGTMRAYRGHPVFFASFAYCLLYVSILSLGGIMTSWLKMNDVSNAVIAVVRGLAAGVGIGSTYCVPFMVKRWGLIQAGLIAIWSQVLMLIPVAFAFVYYFKDSTTQIVIVLIFLCLSRFGLWSFDLCETQIMQESVSHEESGVVNGAQESIINVCYIIGFIL